MINSLTFWIFCAKILVSFGRAAFAESQDKDTALIAWVKLEKST